MKLDDVRAHCVRVAKEEKERTLASSEICAIALHGWRGEQLVVSVRTEDMDVVVGAAPILSVGFDVDVLAMTMDTYLSSTPGNPRTGQAWRKGDLGREAAEHDALARGVIHEVMAVAVFNRADDSIAEVVPYVAAGDHVSWGSDAEMLPSDQLHFGGRVQEVMTEIMRFSYPEFEADPIERPFRDLKAAKEIRRTLGRRSEVTLYAAWGSDEYRLFQRSSHIRVAEPEATQ